jgi:hypothetical protein
MLGALFRLSSPVLRWFPAGSVPVCCHPTLILCPTMVHSATIKASLARVPTRQKLLSLLMCTSRPGYAGSLRAAIRRMLRAIKHIGSSPEEMHVSSVLLLGELQAHGFTVPFMVVVRRLIFGLYEATMELRQHWFQKMRRAHKKWLRKPGWRRLRREALRCAWEG